jgi:hypothetical protein
VSGPMWFCAQCDLRGSETAMRAHGTITGHEVGAHEVVFHKDMEVISLGATGAGPKNSAFSYVHANWCPVEDCPNRVLEDDEILVHLRNHIAREASGSRQSRQLLWPTLRKCSLQAERRSLALLWALG